MKWPIIGSPRPGEQIGEEVHHPGRVPARLWPTRSGHSAQNEDCGPVGEEAALGNSTAHPEIDVRRSGSQLHAQRGDRGEHHVEYDARGNAASRTPCPGDSSHR